MSLWRKNFHHFYQHVVVSDCFFKEQLNLQLKLDCFCFCQLQHNICPVLSWWYVMLNMVKGKTSLKAVVWYLLCKIYVFITCCVFQVLPEGCELWDSPCQACLQEIFLWLFLFVESGAEDNVLCLQYNVNKLCSCLTNVHNCNSISGSRFVHF